MSDKKPKKRLLYQVVHCDWYTKSLDISFEQIIQQHCDDGWIPQGGVMRHPTEPHFYQAMTKEV